MYALHGMTRDAWNRFSDAGYRHYQVVVPGFKYNMMDLQAAIGIHQMPHVDEWLLRRESIWARYDDAFADLAVQRPAQAERDTVHARHLYTLLVDEDECGVSRDAFMARLHARGIGTGVHYTAVHVHPWYRETFGLEPKDFPNAAWIGERTVSIPLSPHLRADDVERVITAVRQSIES
jgi:dTDP-4-amino-4,6-dideoxygalactose transaminase